MPLGVPDVEVEVRLCAKLHLPVPHAAGSQSSSPAAAVASTANH